MSLTSFIKKPDITAGLKERISRPNISLPKDMICDSPPSYSTYRNLPSLAGTAADYLIRAGIKLKNPDSRENQWAATKAITQLDDLQLDVDTGQWDRVVAFPGGGEGMVSEEPIPGVDLQLVKDRAKEIYDNARSEYDKTISSGKLSEGVALSLVRLSQLDSIYRAGLRFSLLANPTLCPVDGEEDVAKDILNLYDHTPWENLKSKHHCMLNPSFGEASKIVGGADADLVIDNCIIDFKTVKNTTNRFVDTLHQLAGYFALSQIGSIDGDQVDIGSVGIYYCRQATLVNIPIEKLIIGDVKEFINWFSDMVSG